VIEAEDGAVALGLARNYPADGIHLVVADAVMPRVGGTELAQWFRVRRPRCKVLLVSPHSDGDVSHSGAERPRHYLQKPFSPSSLARKVREVLDEP
jgi:response regulator RpfG family c-di-GMP phosphodiesterase